MTRDPRSARLARVVLALLVALALTLGMARPMLDAGVSSAPRYVQAEAAAPALPMLVSLVFGQMTHVPIPVHGAPHFTP